LLGYGIFNVINSVVWHRRCLL